MSAAVQHQTATRKRRWTHAKRVTKARALAQEAFANERTPEEIEAADQKRLALKLRTAAKRSAVQRLNSPSAIRQWWRDHVVI